MQAVILAGGKGTRLAPYTTVFPKPLMPVGDVPILEIVIRQLKHAGVQKITLAVGYLSELLMAYFGDGSKLGVTIHYSREEEPLGTAGPLGLIQDLDTPFFVMNGDLLTTLNYRHMWETHNNKSDSPATVATYQREVKIDLGVLEVDAQQQVQKYIEKPTYHYTVSTGIYIFDPEVLQHIKPNQYMDLPDLIRQLLADNRPVSTYAFNGYWLDIGRHDDYAQAIHEFESNQAAFLPQG